MIEICFVTELPTVFVINLQSEQTISYRIVPVYLVCVTPSVCLESYDSRYGQVLRAYLVIALLELQL